MNAKERARLAYHDRQKGMTYKEIAEKYGIAVSTVKAMPRRYWQQLQEEAQPHTGPAAGYGMYEGIYWDVLDEEEKAMLRQLPMQNEEFLLTEEIMMLTVRERRLMKQMKEKQDESGSLQPEYTGSRPDPAFQALQKLEGELTKVQGKKTRCIEVLNRLRQEHRKQEQMQTGDSNDTVRIWTEQVLKRRGEKTEDG